MLVSIKAHFMRNNEQGINTIQINPMSVNPSLLYIVVAETIGKMQEAFDNSDAGITIVDVNLSITADYIEIDRMSKYYIFVERSI